MGPLCKAQGEGAGPARARAAGPPRMRGAGEGRGQAGLVVLPLRAEAPDAPGRQ